MRIGIFGGTFNPPHIGHIYIAREAMKKAELDKMVFIPCGNPPHKDSCEIESAKHRFNMVSLAISKEKNFENSDIEIRLDEFSYTANTLRKLKDIYPREQLCFLVGGDSLVDMEKWYHPERIFPIAEIVVAMRGGQDSQKVLIAAEKYRHEYGANIRFIEIEPMDVSASHIRDMLRSGETPDGIVPRKVLEYIKENGIYREKSD